MINGKLLNKIIGLINKTSGVSVDIKTWKIIPRQDNWLFPKYPSKTRILPYGINLKSSIIEYLDNNTEWLLESDCFLGIWLNPKSKEFYFDITTTENNKDIAIQRAKKISVLEGRNIVAIYNPLKKKTIYL